MKIAMVADGGRSAGMGHVFQSLSLARALGSSAHIQYFTQSDAAVMAIIQEGGYPVLRVQDDAQLLASLQRERPDVVILDKLDVNEQLAAAIRGTTDARLAIFTNLSGASRYAHVVVLPRAPSLKSEPSRRFENLAYRDGRTGSCFFYGPQFWVLRPEFHAYRLLAKPPPREVRHIAVAFGGSDPTDLTCRVLGELLGAPMFSRVDVILGSHYGGLPRIEALLKERAPAGPMVQLHRNARNVGELLYGADLAITAAGMTMFEALCVGTPVIVIPQDDLQRETYAGWIRFLEPEDIAALPSRICAREFTDPREPAIARMRIGEGVATLTECILGNSFPPVAPEPEQEQEMSHARECS